MDLERMQVELGMIVQSPGLEPYFMDWLNDAILEVATDYDLPPLALADPVTLGVNTSKWLWSLPEDFHKNLFLAKGVNADGTVHRIHRIHKNPTHLKSKNHTSTADQVHELAVVPQGSSFFLGIHPLATQDLQLWYYRKPVLLVKAADVCDCIPFNFVPQVIYPKVIIKNYQFITDQVRDFPFMAGPVQYWAGELRKGLFGASGMGTGLINHFNLNFNPPRRTGGRDSIGWRSYYYGTGL